MTLTTATDYALWGIIVHLVIDWLFQNHWMANKKMSLTHPAAWVHSGLHAAALLLVFPPLFAVGVGVAHLLIDTRVPLKWWRSFYRQTIDPVNPFSIHVAIWGDQVLHIAVIAAAALLVVR